MELTAAVGRRTVNEPIPVRGLGADRGKRHPSLSSHPWFARGRGMRKGVGHGGV